jgi:hypothetical protein
MVSENESGYLKINFIKNSIMETSKISIQKLAIKWGGLIFICLVAYFMFMKYMNLIHIIEFRALNFLILVGGIFMGMRNYKLLKKKKMEYLQGLMLGILISAVSAITFALFIGIYFSQIDSLLLEQLKGNALILGVYITPFSSMVTIVLEGMFSGMMISFSLIPYFQNDKTHI